MLNKPERTVKEWQVNRLVTLPDALPKVLFDIKNRHKAISEQGLTVVGLPTGISKLNDLLGGFQPGLHLLAAEPGEGKTTFALQAAAHVAQMGYPALFRSFKESLYRLIPKVLCMQKGLITKNYMDGYGDPRDIEQVVKEYGQKLEPLYFIEGTTGLTVSDVKREALQIMTRKNTNKCLIVVDYLQRWASNKREFNDFRYVVSALVGELQELSLRLNIPILVISSQNRVGQRSVSLLSLKESGDLEYSADTVMFLVKAKKRTVISPVRAVDLVIEKNRYGDKGRVELIFRPDIGIFRVNDEH
jgi:replicative DNA helicase